MAVWQINMVHLFLMTSFLKCEMILFGHLANHQELLFSAFLVFWWVRCTMNSARKHEKIYQSLFSLLKLPNIYIQQKPSTTKNPKRKSCKKTHRLFAYVIRPIRFNVSTPFAEEKRVLPKRQARTSDAVLRTGAQVVSKSAVLRSAADAAGRGRCGFPTGRNEQKKPLVV